MFLHYYMRWDSVLSFGCKLTYPLIPDKLSRWKMKLNSKLIDPVQFLMTHLTLLSMGLFFDVLKDQRYSPNLLS